MNRTGFKIFAIILLLFSIVFQGTYIAQGKKEKEIPSIDMLDSDENQLKEQKSSMHIPLEDYINKLNGYEYFKELWDKAVNKETDFIPFFVGWNELSEYPFIYPLL